MAAKISDRVSARKLANDEPIQAYEADGVTVVDLLKVNASDQISIAADGQDVVIGGTVNARNIATDGAKLDGIATGANNYTLPSGYATETYVGTQISALVDSSPAALDTLNELAAAIGDDANFSTTVTNNIATKLPLAGGTLTGDLAVTGQYRQTTAPATYVHASADDLVLGTTVNGHSGMTIVSGTSGFGDIFFSKGTVATDQYAGYIQYNHSTDTLSFGVGGSPTMNLASTGLAVTGNLAFTKDLKPQFNSTRPTAWDTNSYIWSKSGVSGGLHLDGYRVYLSTGNSETVGLEVDVNQNVNIPNGNLNVSGTTTAPKFVASSGNPSVGADGLSLYATGSYGGGLGFRDGSIDHGIWLQSGVARFAKGAANTDLRSAANVYLDIDSSNNATFYGTTTGTGGFNLPNDTPIRGVPTGGGTVRMLKINSSNQVEVGSTNSTLVFTAAHAIKKTGTVTDISLTRGNSTSGRIDVYRNNGNNPWSIVGGQAGVTLDLELDYQGSLRGDFNSTTGAYTALSLRKFKDDIEDVVDPYETIRRLRPRTYTMSGVETAGYIYDEVDGVLDIASMDTEINQRPIGVNHDVINTYTTAAVQRLIVASEVADAKIAQLEADIQELRGLLT